MFNSFGFHIYIICEIKISVLTFLIYMLSLKFNIIEPEDFKMVKKYNINLLITNDDRVQAYISEIMEQVKS